MAPPNVPLQFENAAVCGRGALIRCARDNPDLLDVAAGPYLSLRDQEKYKYILYVEGWAGWANRLKLLLAMQAAVLLQLNPLGAKEWYTLSLEPWVHYIPVDHLFTSTPAAVKWARGNDPAVRQISANADAYADWMIGGSGFEEFGAVLLARYASLVRYRVAKAPGAVQWDELVAGKKRAGEWQVVFGSSFQE